MSAKRKEYDTACTELSAAEANYAAAEDRLIKARRRHTQAARLLDEDIFAKLEKAYSK
jgi:hypothetical protein